MTTFIHHKRHCLLAFGLTLHLKTSINSFEFSKTPFSRMWPGQCVSSRAHLIAIDVCVSHQSCKDFIIRYRFLISIENLSYISERNEQQLLVCKVFETRQELLRAIGFDKIFISVKCLTQTTIVGYILSQC